MTSNASKNDEFGETDTKTRDRQFWKGDKMLTSKQDAEMRELASKVIENSRPHLSRAVTLVESTNLMHQALAQSLLSHLYQCYVLKHLFFFFIFLSLHKHKNAVANNVQYNKTVTSTASLSSSKKPSSFRIGITGPPGAGKSTFVNKLGSILCKQEAPDNHNVAVLAIDPSSLVSGGSILGDQTRMHDLIQCNNAYVRPSPNKLSLGGVSDSTTEVSKVFESSGYNTIFIETVGVGQAEIEVAHCVDMFVLVITPGAGDDLQGIKRGIMEMADLIVVNKAEGDLYHAARHIRADYRRALQLTHPRRKNWTPKVVLCSCFDDITNEKSNHVMKVWKEVEAFKSAMMESSDELIKFRKEQNKYAAWKYVWRSIRQHVETMQPELVEIESDVMHEKIAPREASHNILNQIWGK